MATNELLYKFLGNRYGLTSRGELVLDGSVIAPLESVGTEIQDVAGTTYELSTEDHNKILNFTSASAVTLTVPAGLGLPFTCGLHQGGVGQVSLQAAVGVTINEIDGLLATEGRYALLALVQMSANVFTLVGRTA